MDTGLVPDAVGMVSDTVGDGVADLASLNDKYLGGMFTNMTLLSLLFSSLNKSDRAFPKTKDTFEKCYDYVIVGGGTAGCVMANRLSQKPCVKVLLLEAGGQPNPLSEIPSFARVLYGFDNDWLYKTTPQEYGAFGQKDKQVFWNSGKGLGGGSIINAMIDIRGNIKNYNDWADEGATGWAYEDVLPYFKKLEDNRNIDELDPGYHNTSGPMTMEKPRYTPEIKDPLLQATHEMGYELTDSNGRRQTGVNDFQGTLRNGRRCSAAKAYLVPADDRENLTILIRAFVTKIIMKGNIACGVEFEFQGKTEKVCARKEVIISSGTVRTPQIMMLSGIGPREELEKFNIPVVVDLQGVGKNLQDHLASQVNFVLDPLIPNVVVKNLNPVNILQYITDRSGPLASPDQVILLAFLNGLNTTSNSPDFPRQELYFGEYATIDAAKNYNLEETVFAQVYAKYSLNTCYTCIVSLLQPCSRGTITLSSTDPHDPPLINPNYYKCLQDLEDVVEGLKVCLAVGTSDAMQKVGSKPFDTKFPNCETITNQTEYLRCYAKQSITSFWHPVGTARMGQPDDPRSVVDPQLRVIGVKRLRVVNAAVMPIVPSGNTNVPTMMVAEKVYDMMKDDIQCNEEGEQVQTERCKDCRRRRRCQTCDD